MATPPESGSVESGSAESGSAPERDALLVVGMHRSGTSAVALEFAGQGWSLGDSQLETQPGVNRDGFGENRALVEYNDALLAGWGCQWYQLVALPPEGEPGQAAFDEAVAGAAAVIESAFPASGRILLKDPRLCLTLPIWRQALQRLGWRTRVILQLRHPVSVADSLQRRDRIPGAIGMLLWVQYMRSAEQASRGMERAVLHYEVLLEQGADALRLFPDLALADDAGSAVDPSLCHSSHEGFDEAGAIADLCSTVMSALASPELAESRAALDALAGDVFNGLEPAARRDAVNALLAALLASAAEAVSIGEAHREALATLVARDADIETVRQYASECELAVAGKDKEIDGIRSHADQCAAAVAEKDREIDEIRRYAEECESAVQRKDAEIAEVSDYARQCEETVAVRDQSLQQLAGDLRIAGERLEDRDAELTAIRGQFLYRVLRKLGLLREP